MDNMSQMVAAVRRHAEANYNSGGWDNVVESFEDEEIEEILLEENVQTEAEAIKVMGEFVSDLADQETDIKAEAF